MGREDDTWRPRKFLLCPSFLLFTTVVVFTVISRFPPISAFDPRFVWATVNKMLDEDRLNLVDAMNDKVKIKWCTKLILSNREDYLKSNYSVDGIFANVTNLEDFATNDIVNEVEAKMDAVNVGYCVPCIVVISIVDVTSLESDFYGKNTSSQKLANDEKAIQNQKLHWSQQFTKLLQFKTPIQARHLVLVRLVEKKEDLSECHGKKYTKYPRRLVSLWEQVLFDHFQEARVIQGATEGGLSEPTLLTGKETGIWVWMCEEIVRRLERRDKCRNDLENVETCKIQEKQGNFSTAAVNMTNKEECVLYRPRT